ncbi:uncharacterized protein LOC128998596 [Macrosteles quadrilineatus]|uniref:uncharacterized protein LOC128998596 n=1 Tax=Macrosteles quadrilineatus TaxID=74068 RepID=UPI0023E27B0B|nr:uncharacterized protein LOC128998596 [Macrosteles quadrilineatus]
MAPCFTCELCDKAFNSNCNLKRHYKNVHLGYEPSKLVQSSLSLTCGLCRNTLRSNVEFESHLNTHHAIVLNVIEVDFNNVSEFEKWKSSVEGEQNCLFVKHTGKRKNNDGSASIVYYCNRSGNFKGQSSPSKRKRHLKIQGSCKINAYCPAKISAKFESNGIIKVRFCKTHVGHEAELAHIPLSEIERRELASKIAQKVPFDTILENVQKSLCGEIKRRHLLTKQDLRNIAKEYSLDSECILHYDDSLSIDSWVEQVRSSDDDCVLIYKPKGDDSPDYPQLQSQDFILGIMTKAQEEMLKKYGGDVICMDSTHGTNAYNYEMTTLLVLDDMRQGFPCAFYFSNRNDHVGIKIFLQSIKNRIGCINTKILMADMAAVFYNSWKSVMGDVEKRLFCTWHVQRAWQKKVNHIKNEGKRRKVNKMMFTLLYEIDERAFESILPVFLDDLCADTDTAVFGKYVADNYVENRMSWAYCYRKNAGIYTNMHLERLHGIFKHFYSRGETAKRLDLTVHALMRFINQKLFDRIVVLHKGKLTSKLRNIRDRHKKCLSLSSDCVLQSSNDSWAVFSSVNMYTVTENVKSCSCSLKCVYCKVCIHKFSCTCSDACIQWNMCKHIHLVCQTLKNRLESHPVLDPHVNDDEKTVIVSAVSKSEETTLDLESAKQEVSCQFSHIINEISSFEQLEIIKKNLKSLQPQIDAVREGEQLY